MYLLHPTGGCAAELLLCGELRGVFSMSQPAKIISAVEATRNTLFDMVNSACDGLIAKLAPQPAAGAVKYKMPTLADGHDPRNKNGLNLTPRGVEILYRV